MEILSKKLSARESTDSSKSDREISPTRKSSKSEQKRKKSMATPRDSEKSKRNQSKGRQSMVPSAPELPGVLEYLRTIASKNDDTNIDESKPDKDEMANDLSKLTIEDAVLDETRSAALIKNKYSIGDFTTMNEKITLCSRESEENVQLEAHLKNNNEFGITGILNLSSMNLHDSDLPTVVQHAFEDGSKKCTGLILRDNALTADGIRIIVDKIIANRAPLKHLNLSSNPNIGDAGIEHVVRLLQRKRSMTFLALPQTGITDRGVKLLADAFSENDLKATNPSALEKIYISFNKGITDKSIASLLRIIEQNPRLTVLSIDHCSLAEETHQQLQLVATKLKKKKFSFSG